MTKHDCTALAIASILLLFLCKPTKGEAQIKFRQVVIYKDTIVEFQKEGGYDDPYIPYGIDIYMNDSPGKTWVYLIKSVKNNDLHGDTYLFDPFTGLPISKERYDNGLQDGLSYYWNNQGVLIRTERWKRGKLMSRQIHRK